MDISGLQLKHALVICSRDRAHNLLEMLSAIYAQNDSKFPADIFLVLNMRSEEDYSLIVSSISEYKGVNIRVLRTTRGLPSARNLALQHLPDADVVHFLDDDVIVSPSYFQDIEIFLHENLDVDGGAPIEGSNAKVGKSIKFKILKQHLGLLQVPGLVSVSMRNYWGPAPNQKSFRVDWLPGLAMFYRSSAIQNSFFCEKLEAHTLGGYGLGEDLFFTLGLSTRGIQLHGIPSLKVSHLRLPNVTNNSDYLHYAIGEMRAELYKKFPHEFKLRYYFASLFFELFVMTYHKPFQFLVYFKGCVGEVKGFITTLAKDRSEI